MYLYRATITAKPNLFSSDFEIREIRAELFHNEQMPFGRTKEWILAELDSQLKNLTAIMTVSYSMEYRPELAVKYKGELIC